MAIYKGESLKVIFTAYNESGATVDTSAYTKAVNVFTDYSEAILPTVTVIDTNSFSISLSPTETLAMVKGELIAVVSFTLSGTVRLCRVKIGDLIDPAEEEGASGISIDSGIIDIPLTFKS
ncbi:MAG: hypothetical protein ABFC84_13390 [Veillonellales bacterium]